MGAKYHVDANKFQQQTTIKANKKVMSTNLCTYLNMCMYTRICMCIRISLVVLYEHLLLCISCFLCMCICTCICTGIGIGIGI